MAEDKTNKRALERFNLEIPAKISMTGHEDNVIELITRDISSGGAFLQTSQPLPEGTDVKIDLILPIDNLLKNLEKLKKDYNHTQINVTGKVLRTDSNGMAIAFDKGFKIRPWEG